MNMIKLFSCAFRFLLELFLLKGKLSLLQNEFIMDILIKIYKWNYENKIIQMKIYYINKLNSYINIII